MFHDRRDPHKLVAQWPDCATATRIPRVPCTPHPLTFSFGPRKIRMVRTLRIPGLGTASACQVSRAAVQLRRAGDPAWSARASASLDLNSRLDRDSGENSPLLRALDEVPGFRGVAFAMRTIGPDKGSHILPPI